MRFAVSKKCYDKAEKEDKIILMFADKSKSTSFCFDQDMNKTFAYLPP